MEYQAPSMHPSSIQNTLILLLSSLALLVIVFVGVTFWAVDQQKHDSLVINLAGRQRMLAQQMARYSLEIQLGGDEKHLGEVLQLSMESFERTLFALHYGGEAPHLPGQTVELSGTQNPEIQAKLDTVQQTWEAFKAALITFQSASPETAESISALQDVQLLSQVLAQQADEAVSLYETDALEKSFWLVTILVVFFTFTLVFLLTAAWYLPRSVLIPLAQLKESAVRIGTGDLMTPVHVRGGEEIFLLSEAINSTRIQLRQSQEELRSWAVMLERRVDQRTRELEALYQVSGEISSRLDVQHVLRTVTDKARELLGAQVASLCLLEPNLQNLTLNALSGPAVAVTGQKTSSSVGLAGGILTRDEAAWCAASDHEGGCGILSPVFRTSHLAAPLRSGERVIGALCIGSSERGAFPQDAAAILTRLANSAAVALENSRLYDQVERGAVLEERQRIAAEMHDGLGQTLSYLGLELDQVGELVRDGQEEIALDRLERARVVIDQAVQEVREAIDSLMQDIPGHRSLQQHLQALVDEFNQGAKIRVKFDSKGKKPLILSRPEVEQVMRAAREALLNVVHHAPDCQAFIMLETDDQEAFLTIQDDGPGFDPSFLPEDGKRHFGLRVMQARASRLGGCMLVESAPGQGTRIVVRWPVSRNGNLFAG